MKMYEKVIIIPQSLHFISERTRTFRITPQANRDSPLLPSRFHLSSYFLSFHREGWKEFIRISRDCYGNF